jgi:hypothetical protein
MLLTNCIPDTTHLLTPDLFQSQHRTKLRVEAYGKDIQINTHYANQELLENSYEVPFSTPCAPSVFSIVAKCDISLIQF